MALSLKSIGLADSGIDASTPLRPRARNDAFSFWKLDENWRMVLEPLIDSSEPIAVRYLFEGYLNDKQRRPPSAMDAASP